MGLVGGRAHPRGRAPSPGRAAHRGVPGERDAPAADPLRAVGPARPRQSGEAGYGWPTHKPVAHHALNQ